METEGNLNPYKPLGCMYSQFSLSRGDIVLQLLGFGVGGAICGIAAMVIFGLVFLYAIFVYDFDWSFL